MSPLAALFLFDAAVAMVAGLLVSAAYRDTAIALPAIHMGLVMAWVFAFIGAWAVGA